MTIPPRSVLEEVFRKGYPEAVVTAIEQVGISRGRLLAARALSEAWITQNRGDKNGVALWIRKEMMKQMGNE